MQELPNPPESPSDEPVPIEPSRRRPPRQPNPESIPIPEASVGRAPRRAIKLQDLLEAHQRAVDVRLEEGLRELRLAVSEGIRRAVHLRVAGSEAPVGTPDAALPGRDEIVRGMLTHTEERFQAMSLRLRKLEEAIRDLGRRQGVTSVEGYDRRLEDVAQGIERLTEEQRRSFEDVSALHRGAIERIAAENRSALEDLTRRMGAGVAAVARTVRDQMAEAIDDLRNGRNVPLLPGAAPGPEAASIERTLLAVAERQEAILDRHLSALRGSVNALHRSVSSTGR